MKQKIANWLIRIAAKLYPSAVEGFPIYGEPLKLGLRIHVSKKDIRKYRRMRPDIHSFRAAKRAIIEDTKNKIGMSISGTMAKKRLIHYDVETTSQGATVSGYIGVYVSKNKKKELGLGE